MVQVATALIWQDGKFMICQRPPHKGNGLLWEFVGGKAEAGETLQEALRRECREELGVTVEVGDIFDEADHVYPDISVHITLFNARIVEGEPQLFEHVGIRWITPEEISDYSFCAADGGMLEKIKNMHGQN